MATRALDTVRHLISLFEEFKAAEALELFTDDATYRFGNFPTAVGKEQIRQAAASSHMDFIKGISFKIIELVEVGDAVFCEMEITYTKTDGSTVTLPCTDVFRMQNEKIKEMRIYMDPSPLFAHQG